MEQLVGCVFKQGEKIVQAVLIILFFGNISVVIIIIIIINYNPGDLAAF